MSSGWTGSVELLDGQIATLTATVSGESFIIRASMPQIAFEADFVYTGTKFFFETPPNDNLLSVEAVDDMPGSDTRSFRLRAAALTDGEFSASWSITSGPASLVQATLAAE